MLDPVQNTTFSVEFPATLAKSFSLRESRTHELAPGRFGSVSVQGHLALDSGSYYFDSLSVSDSGSIDLLQHDGPTLIFVKDKLNLNGALRRLTKQGDLAIIDVGNQDVNVAHSFRGVIAAPNARLELGTLHDELHSSHRNWGLWSWGKSGQDHHSSNSHDDHGSQGDHDSNTGHASSDDHGKSGASHDEDDDAEVFEGAFYGKDVERSPHPRWRLRKSAHDLDVTLHRRLHRISDRARHSGQAFRRRAARQVTRPDASASFSSSPGRAPAWLARTRPRR